jgi:hypothetical protein
MSVRSQIFLALAGCAFVLSCSLIDDDLSTCEPDSHLDYSLQLVTNMTAELKTQLSLESDIQVSAVLNNYLGSVFTDFAHDLDLSFYDVTGDSLRLHHEAHVMDASESTYTLFIPVRNYMHLAVANVEKEPLVSLVDADKCHHSALVQTLGDTIPSHRSALFTARQPMKVLEREDQEFDVSLFMVNCASALVLDTLQSGVRDVKVYMKGFATSFDICDSLYHFDRSPVVKADSLPADGGDKLCFSAIHFPSRRSSTKAVVEIEDEGSEGDGTTLWQIAVYCRLPDGTITETVLDMTRFIAPGCVRVVKGTVTREGSVEPTDHALGVSVTLDWKKGGEQIIVL